MSIFEAALILVGTAVLLLSLSASNVRGAVWVGAILLDLIISTAYWRANLPYADAFTAFCDFSVCVLIYVFGKYRFELWVMLLYMSSMLVSIIDLAMMIWAPGWLDHDSYSSALELVNYIAFFTIGGVSAYAVNDRRDISAFALWRWFRPAGFPLYPQGARDQE